MRQPGIEPGSIAWKATMLTFTPPTLAHSVSRHRHDIPAHQLTGGRDIKTLAREINKHKHSRWGG